MVKYTVGKLSQRLKIPFGDLRGEVRFGIVPNERFGFSK